MSSENTKKKSKFSWLKTLSIIAALATIWGVVDQVFQKWNQKTDYSEVTISQSTFFLIDESKIATEAEGVAEEVRWKLPNDFYIYSNGKKRDKLAVDRLTISNTGETVIQSSDYIEPIVVTPPNGARIIDVYLTRGDERWMPKIFENKVIFPAKALNIKETILCNVVYEFKNAEWNTRWDWKGNIAKVPKLKYVKGSRPADVFSAENSPTMIYSVMRLLDGKTKYMYVSLSDYDILLFLFIYTIIFWISMFYVRGKDLLSRRRRGLYIYMVIMSVTAITVAEIVEFATLKFIPDALTIWRFWIPCIMFHLIISWLYKRSFHKNFPSLKNE